MPCEYNAAGGSPVHPEGAYLAFCRNWWGSTRGPVLELWLLRRLIIRLSGQEHNHSQRFVGSVAHAMVEEEGDDRSEGGFGMGPSNLTS